MSDNEQLADELFELVQKSQGMAFVSDAEGAGMSREQFFRRIRGRLEWSKESCKQFKQFLKKYGELNER
jgi:hypothetical protein